MSQGTNHLSDLSSASIELDYLLQFREDAKEDPHDATGGIRHNDPKEWISVKPWHDAVDWAKRETDL